MFDALLTLLPPETKLGLALWAMAFFVAVLVAAAVLLGWAILS